MRILLPLYGLLIVVFAVGVVYVFKAGLDHYVASNSLAEMQIDPPDGWTVRPYQLADGAAITGSDDDPAAAIGTTATILNSFDIPTGGLKEGAVKTFQRDNEMLALRLERGPHEPKRVSLADRLGYGTPEETLDPDTVFATVAGLPLIVHPRESIVEGMPAPRPVNYRYFTMTIGDKTIDEVMEVAVLTNSSDAALVAILDRVDIAFLNERLPTPDTRVMASAGVLTRDALPLSDVPPRPTPAYRALELLASGQSFDAPWGEALAQIRDGQITSFEELQIRYPRIDTLPYALLEVLEDGSQTSTARYYARILSNSGRAWSGHEFHVLSTIAEVGSTQADLNEYLAGQYDVAAEVLALAKRLPEGPAAGSVPAQVVQSGVVPTAGLRNAATCVLENGVRRCTVGSN
ncbi:hypothetical protein SLH49_03625 [Cognatiyoonia sp. IB215446]|uniref:hypothetical protein n=1 Tax=Cognatiyoonia sp. IB215446 TaxID=3097355 RepID=UPI002A111121|nr:hypothetical protein [Cognatiyoonia sp. IB215446]MDX8347067.1 hypothetical protein [Cognatiyoonia sp. IB215446]